MVTNRCPELVEIIPSIGARFALQNYFLNNDKSKEIIASSELALPSTSTSFVTPTLALTPQEIFEVAVPLDNKASIISDTETSTENIIPSSLVETPSVNNAQNFIILNANCENKVSRKRQRIEIVDNMVCKIIRKCLKYMYNIRNIYISFTFYFLNVLLHFNIQNLF